MRYKIKVNFHRVTNFSLVIHRNFNVKKYFFSSRSSENSNILNMFPNSQLNLQLKILIYGIHHFSDSPPSNDYFRVFSKVKQKYTIECNLLKIATTNLRTSNEWKRENDVVLICQFENTNTVRCVFWSLFQVWLEILLSSSESLFQSLIFERLRQRVHEIISCNVPANFNQAITINKHCN